MENINNRKELLIKEIITLLNNEDNPYWIYPKNVPFIDKYHIVFIQNNHYGEPKPFQVALRNILYKTNNQNFTIIEQDKLFLNMSLMDLFYIKILCLNENYEKIYTKRKPYRRNK
jgi:hypothetical protein